MAILSPTNFKGFEVTAYVSLEHFEAQKQINRTLDGVETKLWTITADIFVWKEPEKINLLETKIIHFTTESLDGLTVASVFEKIKETYPGEDC